MNVKNLYFKSLISIEENKNVCVNAWKLNIEKCLTF